MARTPPSLVYVGLKGQIVAFKRSTGQEVWRTKLKRSLTASYVHLYRDARFLYAMTGGELWCLEPATGATIWHDPLKGMGTDLGSMTSDEPLGMPQVPVEPAMVAAMRRAAAGAAAS
jgi:outer membrane protein assembly factor BamB